MKDNIFEEINKSKKILILAHEKPDGDAVGSSFALYHLLKNLNKEVDIVLLDVPETFKYIKDFDQIKNKPEDGYDLCIVVDCAKDDRIGAKDYDIKAIQNIINIDHHHTNTIYGKINYVDSELSSCSEVLYYLFKDKYQITKEIGEALLTGLLTDTGGFANDNVLPSTLRMASELTELGVDFHKVINKAVSTQTKRQFELFNIARERLVFYSNSKIAYTYILKEDLDRLGCVPGDHEGIVDIGRNVEGVEVSVFIHEDDGFRVSLRSNGKVDVSEIALQFNGGGHKMAAGCLFIENIDEAKENIIDAIQKKL